MKENPHVNRCLSNKHFDRIDHALGRPVDPLGETYRDHYAIGGGTALAAHFRASSHWIEARDPSRHWVERLNRASVHWIEALWRGDAHGGLWGQTAFFYVSQAGREALTAHLREIGDRNRAYIVVFDGQPATVVATKRSEAKYRAYLVASDCWSELTFREFCRLCSSVKLAA